MSARTRFRQFGTLLPGRLTDADEARGVRDHALGLTAKKLPATLPLLNRTRRVEPGGLWREAATPTTVASEQANCGKYAEAAWRAAPRQFQSAFPELPARASLLLATVE
jgi:hypothetical protein